MSKQILFLGEFSSGKSAFINLVLGVSLLPENLAATNLPVIKIFKGANDYPSGLWLREGNERNPKPLAGWTSVPKNWDSFSHAEVTVPNHPILKDDVILWDTPGINSTDAQHNKHLDKFLTDNLSKMNLCVFFMRENLTSTSLAFLRKYSGVIKNSLFIQNIHDTKTHEECFKIFSNNKSILRKEFGLVPCDLLYIGDVCDEFNILSDEQKDGYDEYDIMRKWDKIKIDVDKLIQKHSLTVIGTELLKEVFAVSVISISTEVKKPAFSPTDKQKAYLNSQSFRDFSNPNGNIIEMMFVEGGTFKMGSANGDNDAKPVHEVTLDSFYIGKYVITQKEWIEIMGNNPGKFKGNNLPIENVSWNEVQAFLRKLNNKNGMNYRLPTEAEWEYAAKGGNKSNGYVHAGSNDCDDVAWSYTNSANKTHSVGLKQPNELGIFDMSGNVLEWCSDWYDEKYYQKSPSYNPKGSHNLQINRVLRGGSYYGGRLKCYSTERDMFEPSSRASHIGFRLAMDA